jgi:hypothetical protein
LAANPNLVDIVNKMKNIFSENIAVPFSHDWLHRSVDAGYLSRSVISPPPTPSKTLPSTPVTPSEYADASKKLFPNTLPVEVANNDSPSFVHPAIQDEHSAPDPFTSSIHSSVIKSVTSSNFPTIIAHNRKIEASCDDNNEQPLLPHEVSLFLADLKRNSVEDITFIEHIYTKVGRDRWMPLVKTHFSLSYIAACYLVQLLDGP